MRVSNFKSPSPRFPQKRCAGAGFRFVPCRLLTSRVHALLATAPPTDYDFRADTSKESLQIVSSQWPQLLDLIADGSLIVHQRSPNYKERRQDGYQEPQLVFIVGTAHVSTKSAEDVQRVIEKREVNQVIYHYCSSAPYLQYSSAAQAVQPDSVVVELCRSRAAIMYSPQPEQQQDPSSPVLAVSQPLVPALMTGTQLLQPATLTSSSSSGSSGGQSSSDHGSSSSSSPDAHPTPSPTSHAASASASENSTDAGSSSSSRPSLAASSSPLSPPSLSASTMSQPSLSASTPKPATLPPLQRPNTFGLSGEGFLATMQRSVSLGGQSGLLFRFLLAGLVRRVAGGLNVTPGAEFIAARLASEKTGSQLVLGDRPIEITLQRAWASLTMQQQAQMCFGLLVASVSPLPQAVTADMVERMKGDGEVSALFEQMGATYPGLLGPLVYERDLYLAWSLTRSKAVNGAQRVVGVIGRGHFRGVLYAMRGGSDSTGIGSGLRFSDLVDGKNSTAGKQKAKRELAVKIVLETALAAALFLAWDMYTDTDGSGVMAGLIKMAH